MADIVQEYFHRCSLIKEQPVYTYAIKKHRIKNKPKRSLSVVTYIDQQIAELRRKMRAIFEMSLKERSTYKEIAAQLDTTENNVSKQINIAVLTLRAKSGPISLLLFLLPIGFKRLQKTPYALGM